MSDQDAADEDMATDDDSATTREPASAEAAGLRRTIAELRSIGRERRRFLDMYAYILVRIGRADAKINDEETQAMERAVVKVGDLSDEQGALLVTLAVRMRSLYGATEDYIVAREFARLASPQQRQRLLRACVTVARADGHISPGERSELNEIGRELGFGIDEIDAIREQIDPSSREPAEPTEDDPPGTEPD